MHDFSTVSVLLLRTLVFKYYISYITAYIMYHKQRKQEKLLACLGATYQNLIKAATVSMLKPQWLKYRFI